MKMDILKIAMVCHEANKALCEGFGDVSQASWNEAPEWQRESAIKGVEFHISNPDAGPESSHEAWCKDKYDAGWMFGPVKDEHKKEHPCLVQFPQLPQFQQSKDYVFRSIVHAMVAARV